jgi:hypothetical protein
VAVAVALLMLPTEKVRFLVVERLMYSMHLFRGGRMCERVGGLGSVGSPWRLRGR